MDLLCLYRPVFQSVDLYTQSIILQQAVSAVRNYTPTSKPSITYDRVGGSYFAHRVLLFQLPLLLAEMSCQSEFPFHSFSDVVPHYISIIHELNTTEQSCVTATIWTRIREVLGLNICWATGYPDFGFPSFSSIPLDNSIYLQG